MTISFSTTPPRSLNDLTSTVESAMSQMSTKSPTSKIEKQQYFKKRIQHYEDKYISVKNETNVEHKFIFGFVLLELYQFYRKTDESVKKCYTKELIYLLGDCEKYKDEIKHLRERYENRLKLNNKQDEPEEVETENVAEEETPVYETSTKEDDSTPSPNPPSVEENYLEKPYKNQIINMQEFFQCMKHKQSVLIIDYRDKHLQNISKPSPNAKSFSSLKIADLDIENLPNSIMLDDFSEIATPNGLINTKDYQLVIFLDQTGEIEITKTALYTAFTKTSLNPMAKSRILKLDGGFLNGWIKSMPQYTTDSNPDWNSPKNLKLTSTPSSTDTLLANTSLAHKNLSNTELLTFTEGTTTLNSSQSTISKLASDFNRIDLSTMPSVPDFKYDLNAAGHKENSNAYPNVSTNISTPKFNRNSKPKPLILNKKSSSFTLPMLSNSIDDNSINYNSPAMNRSQIDLIPEFHDSDFSPRPSGGMKGHLPAINRSNKPTGKPKTPCRSNKPMPIESVDRYIEIGNRKLKRAGSLSDIPSTTSIDIPTPSISDLREPKPRFTFSTTSFNHDSIENRSVRDRVKQITSNPAMPLSQIRGLKNLGNTCYMNAVLQCLVRVPVFKSYLMSGEFEKDVVPNNKLGYRGQLITEFAKLTRDLHYTGNFIVPKDVRAVLASRHSDFGTYTQQDAQEFLMVFLDGLHEEINRARAENKKIVHEEPPDTEFDFCSKTVTHKQAAKLFWNRHLSMNKGAIVELFQGQFVSITKSSKTEVIRRSFESFMCISVPIPEKETNFCDLNACLTAFKKSERINDWYDPQIKSLVEADRTMRIWKAPKILIVHIKRFKTNNYGIICEKLHTRINVPKKLEVLEECGNSEKEYRLFGIVDHSGKTLNSGHYKAQCNHPESKSMWFMFDDQDVSDVKNVEDKIQNSSTAYMCFYADVTL